MVPAFRRQIIPSDWQHHPHTCGTGAISRSPFAAPPLAVGLVIEIIAPSVEMASAAATAFKQNLLHYGFAGRLSTAGNIAFPFTPPELDAGEAHRIAFDHEMRGVNPDDGCKVAVSAVSAVG